MIHLYNSLTKTKELLKPLVPGSLSLYVCGVTVDGDCHIGHARVFIVFDVLVRYLRWSGFHVTYVRNITDIDDKIIQRAQEQGMTADAHAAIYIKRMQEDEEALGLVPPDMTPRATEYVDDMIAFIERLIQNGNAYVEGDVYFDVKSMPNYGHLSHRNLTDLQAGARVDVAHTKRSALDFVLWKLAKPGEPRWPSPWGEGRPGWHIECSTMVERCLGETIDIHGGGNDLKFPHHENECAQSEACWHKKFVNNWMHVGAVRMGNEKMSKSLGNVMTIKEMCHQYPSEVIRYFLLATHYRSPLEYHADRLQQAVDNMRKLYTSLRGLSDVETPVSSELTEYKTQFIAALNDDFNTPQAFAVLFEIAKRINHLRVENQIVKAAQLASLLKQLGQSLGLLTADPNVFLQQGAKLDSDAIEKLLREREEARACKNWSRADEVRDYLKEHGVSLEDSQAGTRWHFTGKS